MTDITSHYITLYYNTYIRNKYQEVRKVMQPQVSPQLEPAAVRSNK